MNSFKITTRHYTPSDANHLTQIYYNTIHKINCCDYSSEQINAWAPLSSLEADSWMSRWEKLIPIVALHGETIIGFAEFEPNGHIDCFYVHHEYQGKGVGSALMKAIIKTAELRHLSRIFAEVSISARPFFAKKGFEVIKEQQVIIRGCSLTNYLMEKGC